MAGKYYLTPRELEERWNHMISVRTLANWRSQGKGPPYVKIGGRVVYKVEDVLSWEQARRVRSTSEYVKPGFIGA